MTPAGLVPFLLASCFVIACGPTQSSGAAAPLPAAQSTASSAASPPASLSPAPDTSLAPGPAAPAVDIVAIRVTNPLAAPRPQETLSIALAELRKLVPTLDPSQTLVVGADGSAVLSQLVDTDGDEAPDELVFQTDLGGNETQPFKLRLGKRAPAPKKDYRVYGRFVRERKDDFVWENDRIAHRVYGPALETDKKEALISSGIDAWVKRVPRLLVNDWYLTGDYHEDQGEGADFYSVGKTRGCGGLGVWWSNKLFVSKNFTASRVLSNGPIRLLFELSYAPFDAGGGARVAETKRITLDAGSQFSVFESIFTPMRKGLAVALGIAKHPDSTVEIGEKGSSLRAWEPLSNGRAGNLGCALVLAPASSGALQEAEGNYLFVTPVPANGVLRYAVGSAWDRAGHVVDRDAWKTEVEAFAARRAAAPRVTLEALPSAAANAAAPAH